MTQEQRQWVIKAIENCFDSCVFQHEQERLEMLMAKYVNPNSEISNDELKDDMKFLDKIYG